jgi:hypothetical protein
MVGPHQFSVDLFVLPLSGADIVLGVQWLKTLGPILTDYEHLTMQFMKDGLLVQLIGEPKPSPLESSLHQLRRLVATNSLDHSYHIQLLSLTPTKTRAKYITQKYLISLTNTNTSLNNQLPYHPPASPTTTYPSLTELIPLMYGRTATPNFRNGKLNFKSKQC